MPSQINLIPKVDSTNKSGIVYSLSFYAKNILLVFNAILFVMYGYRFILDRSISRSNTQLQEIRAEIDTYKEFALKYKHYQDLAIFTYGVRVNEVNVLFILDFLNASTPTGIAIKNVQISEGEVTIDAESSSPAEFTTFLGLVLQEKKFSSVILTSSQYDSKEESFTFTLKMSYSYGTN